MARMRDRLEAPVLVGVGAAFDFHAGLVPQAPDWMQRFGLECPATGFAVGVDRVLLALERNGVATNNRTWDVLVAWSEGKLPEAIAKATALRREGRSVKLLTEAADLQGAALAVKEYGCKSLVYVE